MGISEILGLATLMLLIVSAMVIFLLYRSVTDLRREIDIKGRDDRSELRDVQERFESSLGRQIQTLSGNIDGQLKNIKETVDEKLQKTLENKLTASFKSVSDQLERVNKGLGDMRTLAADVGDFKKTLTNVKSRGVFGELQLAALLEDILPSHRYEANAAIKEGSLERVEYAVKLPGKGIEGGDLLLPIDAKFPMEDYHRLINAQESGDKELRKGAEKKLETAIKNEAKKIADKYVSPPKTTEFAIMFLPVEGLFAEVLRIPGLFDYLRRDLGVVVTGPTTLAAFLSSLQAGFRTLAVEHKSYEIQKLLINVKAEFSKYADSIDKVSKKLNEAQSSISEVGVRSRAIDKKLKGVEDSAE